MNSAKLVMLSQFIFIAIIALSVTNRFADDIITEPVSTVTPSSTQTTLQVRPALGAPTPLPTGQTLQGAKNTTDQEAAGDLQRPQTADQLQPNAKLPDFPSGE